MKDKTRIFKLNLTKTLRSVFNLSNFKSGPNIFGFALFVIAALVIITSDNTGSLNDISNFEVGRVADRDVIAEYAVSYIDVEATKQRLEEITGSTPAVFYSSIDINSRILNSWNVFCNFTDRLDGIEIESAHFLLDIEYNRYYTDELIGRYLSSENYTDFRAYGQEVLNQILEKGIYVFSPDDIINYNKETAELVFVSETGQQLRSGLVSYYDIITMQEIPHIINSIVNVMDVPDNFKNIAADLLKPFITGNIFFINTETQRRIEDAVNEAGPVVYNIEKGKRIIRRGFIITEDEMEGLRALHLSLPRKNPRNIMGIVFLVLLLYVLFVILRGAIITGRNLNDRERYMLAALAGTYIIGSVLLNNLSPGVEGFPVSLLIPTSLFIMIISVFFGTRTAMIMALALPLGAYFAGSFDNYSYIIALVSGIAASTILHNAQDRMSLIKAGLLIAAANCSAVIIVLLLQGAGLNTYPSMLLWAALNGIICGMLTLGSLPPLEQALNAVTSFRLQELSDLNAPILRKLFTTAPGTYSHSLMVANLAEQACQDIGANALLARVGAYYHDIGKMENPGYFVENQTDHNKHDDIAPRLSATVIRSHVKLGVEKAYSMGLPKDVMSIIMEHHGNSVITWFYNKAAEQEEDVSSEDFTYPGNPPKSKESAVVMLADITEAAVRTLAKPSVQKMEKFIQQLFDAKVEHGQLAESDLSFRDLEVIKKAFVKVLAGYYHSRIEYPKQN